MRPPLSEIEPSSSGVVKVTRGLLASASGRATKVSATAAGAAPGAAGGAVPTPGAVPGVAAGAPGTACVTGAGVGVVCLVGKKLCQPTMISTDRTIATMKFFWSIFRFQAQRALWQERPARPAIAGAAGTGSKPPWPHGAQRQK